MNDSLFDRYAKTYHKKAGRWSVYPLKTDKNYLYHHGMKIHTTAKQMKKGGMPKRVTLARSDPRLLRGSVQKTLPPSTGELVQLQVSRNLVSTVFKISLI